MKKQLSLLATLFSVFCIQGLYAQSTPANALTNVMIHNADGSTLKSASIVWRDGVIEAIGENINIPFDAYKIDGGDSLLVYPGFINGYGTWGSPDTPTDLEPLDDPGNPPYDRAGVQPERKPSELMVTDKNFENALKNGFTTGALTLKGFMLPGKVEVFYLSDVNNEVGLIKENMGLAGSFRESPGGWGNGAYPSTLMGVMAMFRQVMFDATALQQHIQYYSQNPEMPAPDRNNVLEAMFPLINKDVPLLFEVDTKEDIERMFRLQDQFDFEVIIVSGKEAYAKAEELKKRKIPVLASIDFTDAPEWYKKSSDDKKRDEGEKKDEKAKDAEEKEKPEKTEEPSEEEKQFRERQLEAWKKEVSNIRSLLDAGVKVGFATAGLELKDFRKKLEVLLEEGGLSDIEFVKLLTINTAQILGINNVFGELDKGKNASFTVFNKPVSEEKAKVIYNISNGEIHEF